MREKILFLKWINMSCQHVYLTLYIVHFIAIREARANGFSQSWSLSLARYNATFWYIWKWEPLSCAFCLWPILNHFKFTSIKVAAVCEAEAGSRLPPMTLLRMEAARSIASRPRSEAAFVWSKKGQSSPLPEEEKVAWLPTPRLPRPRPFWKDIVGYTLRKRRNCWVEDKRTSWLKSEESNRFDLAGYLHWALSKSANIPHGPQALRKLARNRNWNQLLIEREK